MCMLSWVLEHKGPNSLDGLVFYIGLPDKYLSVEKIMINLSRIHEYGDCMQVVIGLEWAPNPPTESFIGGLIGRS